MQHVASRKINAKRISIRYIVQIQAVSVTRMGVLTTNLGFPCTQQLYVSLPSKKKQLYVSLQANADRVTIQAKMERMDELLYREEMMWLQRSRIAWLNEGDRKAVWRSRKDHVNSLRRDDGSV